MRLIDLGGSTLYDLDNVQREGVEYTQRAGDLLAVIELDSELRASATQAAVPSRSAA